MQRKRLAIYMYVQHIISQELPRLDPAWVCTQTKFFVRFLTKLSKFLVHSIRANYELNTALQSRY